ncbi:hypothetical protein BS78_07G122700 [Paspalum vaginatum]|nr:hypothetical protein BS78_07G122700 [Paspalum vaginatum]
MKRRHHTLNQLMVQIKLKLHKRLRLLSRPVPCALQQRTTAPQLLCNSPSPKMSSKPYCSSCFFCSSKSRCSLGSPTEQQPPKDGVVLGADTRATQGPIVADRNCEKIHYMAPNIYCYGAGTAADTEAVTGLLRDEEMLQPSIYLNNFVPDCQTPQFRYLLLQHLLHCKNSVTSRGEVFIVKYRSSFLI